MITMQSTKFTHNPIESGQLFMWGDGTDGVLGNNNTTGSKFPSESNYFAEKSVKLIACGGTHTGSIIKRLVDLRKLANECKKCKAKLDSIFKKKVVHFIELKIIEMSFAILP
jgi:hypothetical protein